MPRPHQWKPLEKRPFRHRSPFLASVIGSYIPIISSRVQAHFCALEAQANNRLSRGLLDPVQDLKMPPCWIIADIIFAELNKQWALFNDKVVSGASTQNEDSASSNPVRDMYEAVRQGSISHEQLPQTLDEIIFGNLDANMSGISWTVVFLAAHPDTQSRLYEEIVGHRRQASEGSEFTPGTQESLASAKLYCSCISSSSSLLNASILESASCLSIFHTAVRALATHCRQAL